MLTATDLQRQTLRLYGELLARSDVWAGKLVFTSGEGASATGLPAAVSIAGGTTLVLDPDAATVKAVFRTGGIDFVVNTLDEALRVLKNEIRQHKPLSVALIAEVEPVLGEMLERGVSPSLLVECAWPEPSNGSLQQLLSKLALGAIPRLNLSLGDGNLFRTPELQNWLSSNGWREELMMGKVSAIDAHLLTILPLSDTVRRIWLQRISHYQRSSDSRLVWLSSDEQIMIAPSLKDSRS